MNSSPELVECKLFVTPSNSMSESDELNQASELCPLKIGREQLAAVQKSEELLRPQLIRSKILKLGLLFFGIMVF